MENMVTNAKILRESIQSIDECNVTAPSFLASYCNPEDIPDGAIQLVVSFAKKVKEVISFRKQGDKETKSRSKKRLKLEHGN